ARHQRLRRDERGVRHVLHGAVSGPHHHPGGRTAGRNRRRDRVYRKEGAIVDALDLDTPALYVDLDVLERNIARMQEQCRAWGVALRPHVKTHKIAEIAQMQLDAGAIGITVAKVGEAEVLPGDDVLVAYPLVKAKLPRLRELAKTRRVKVAVDSVDVARDLKGIETLVEICVEADCALRVLTTVVSTAVPGQCVIDAGSKTLSSDQTVGPGTYGHFIGRDWTVRKLNEEHGYVEIHGPAHVGEKVWLVPSHVCPTVNLHDEIWYGRRGRVEGSWKVAARGKVR